MPPRKFSVVIIPDDTGKVVEKRIVLWKIVTLFSILTLFFICSVFSVIGYLKANIDRNKLASLKAENDYLAGKIESLQQSVESIKGQMADIIKTDENIRLVFDLPAIDPSIREVGVGGQDFKMVDIESQTVNELSLVEGDIDKILRQIKLENASFSDVFDKVRSKKDILDHTPSIMPVEGLISRGFGMRPNPFTGIYQMHRGIDIAANKGTPIYAAADGKVIYCGWDKGFGNTVIIDHGYGLKTYYGHLSMAKVRKGARVKRRDIIGLVGSTGYSTGPHLHYEVRENGRAVDPMKYIFKSIIFES